jgi:hypothetical protein
MLFISLVATTSLSEVEQQTKVVAHLKSRNGQCPLTDQRTFAHALTDVLRYDALTKRASFIHIERGGSDVDAAIAYYDTLNRRGKVKRSAFGKGNAPSHLLYFASYLALPDERIPGAT